MGLRRQGNTFHVDPVIPPEWPGFSATVTLGTARLDIRVSRAPTPGIRLDGQPVDAAIIPLDGENHLLELELAP